MKAHSVANRILMPCAVMLTFAGCSDVVNPAVRSAVPRFVRVDHPVIVPTLPGLPVTIPAVRGPLDSLLAQDFAAQAEPGGGLFASTTAGGRHTLKPLTPGALLAAPDGDPLDPNSYSNLRAAIHSADLELTMPSPSAGPTAPASARMSMGYTGTNSSQSVSIIAIPLDGAGIPLSGGFGPLPGPGAPMCSATTQCFDYVQRNDVPFYGVGCGYSVQGQSTHRAWLQIPQTLFSSDQQYRFAGGSGDPCATQVAATCGSPSDPPPDGGGTDGRFDPGGSDYEKMFRPRPLFDCDAGGDSGGTMQQICITYISGWYNPDTGEILIDDVHTECWIEQQAPSASSRVPTGVAPLFPDASRAPEPDDSRLGLAAAPGAAVDITLIGTGPIPGGQPTRIVRRRQGEVRDAILVDLSKATAVDLASAVAGDLALRSTQGDGGNRDIEGAVSISSLGSTWQTQERPEFEQQLTRLRSAPDRAVPGVGSGRAITISTAQPLVARQTSKR